MPLILKIAKPLDPDTLGKTLVVNSDTNTVSKSNNATGSLPSSKDLGFKITKDGVPVDIADIFTPVGDVTSPEGARMVANDSTGKNV